MSRPAGTHSTAVPDTSPSSRTSTSRPSASTTTARTRSGAGTDTVSAVRPAVGFGDAAETAASARAAGSDAARPAGVTLSTKRSAHPPAAAVYRAGTRLPSPPMSVQEIEAAIQRLPPAEVAELAEWLDEYRAADWDRRIEADAAAGKLDALVREAQDDITAGRVRPLP